MSHHAETTEVTPLCLNHALLFFIYCMPFAFTTFYFFILDFFFVILATTQFYRTGHSSYIHNIHFLVTCIPCWFHLLNDQFVLWWESTKVFYTFCFENSRLSSFLISNCGSYNRIHSTGTLSRHYMFWCNSIFTFRMFLPSISFQIVLFAISSYSTSISTIGNFSRNGSRL